MYLLGGEEHQAAPLVCALTGHIAREARRLAAFCPGGRLDPPLTLRLDEAALICPVPLDQWTADMGGRGVTIVACFQSRAQLLDRYGDAKTATILNNTGARVLFGGTGDRDDLTFWSTLAGERDEPITTTDLHGRVASRTTRRVPVLAPAQLANLPPGRVVVFPPRSRRSSGGPSRRSAASTCAPTTPRRRGASAPASGSRARPSPGCAARPSLPPARSAGLYGGRPARRSGRARHRLGARHGSVALAAGSIGAIVGLGCVRLL